MIATRWGMLLLATMLTLAAAGAVSDDLQPTALRVLVTAVVGLLSLLFWPGVAATPARTALRIVAWSAAAAMLAAAVLQVLGHAMQPFPKVLASCAMLLLILLVAHALAAALELFLRGRSGDADDARERASRGVAWALVLLGALPLWAGPLAELGAGRHEWLVDGAIAASPLTHLAVASGNDLLRNQWMYQNANLAALRFSYPELTALVAAYAAACVAMALQCLAWQRRRRRMPGPPPDPPHLETSP